MVCFLSKTMSTHTQPFHLACGLTDHQVGIEVEDRGTLARLGGAPLTFLAPQEVLEQRSWPTSGPRGYKSAKGP